MGKNAQTLAQRVFEGIVSGAYSRNMVVGMLEEFEKAAFDTAREKFASKPVIHAAHINDQWVTGTAEEIAAKLNAAKAAITKDKPTAEEVGTPEKPRVKFAGDQGRLTRKPRKRRGMVWVRPGKDAHGNIIKKGYYVKKSKLGRKDLKAAKKIDKPVKKRVQTPKTRAQKDKDLLNYYNKQLFKFNLPQQATLTAAKDHLKAHREKIARVNQIARTNEEPVTMVPPGAAADSPLKAAAARIYQPRHRKQTKTRKKMRRKQAA